MQAVAGDAEGETCEIMADTGRLEVLHDTATIINTYLHILQNTNSRWD